MIYIKKMEQNQALAVAQLLNKYLPFEEESKQTVLSAKGIQYVALDSETVIGYIAGYEIQQVNKQFPYFPEKLNPLKIALSKLGSYYTSHFVVHPSYRGKGIGTQLVKHYMNEIEQKANAVVVVGWVKSDTGLWDAKNQFLRYNFTHNIYIPHYFEPYNVYCPNCNGRCVCDADIYYKTISHI